MMRSDNMMELTRNPAREGEGREAKEAQITSQGTDASHMGMPEDFPVYLRKTRQ
jgi:hypothetical protein